MTMTISGLQALEDFGCHARILEFLDRELTGVSVASRKAQGKGDYCLLLGDPDAQSAAYVERACLNIALDPDDADSLMHQTGLTELERNPTTCRVRVRLADLLGGLHRDLLGEALRRAVARSATGPAAAVARRCTAVVAVTTASAPSAAS